MLYGRTMRRWFSIPQCLVWSLFWISSVDSFLFLCNNPKTSSFPPTMTRSTPSIADMFVLDSMKLFNPLGVYRRSNTKVNSMVGTLAHSNDNSSATTTQYTIEYSFTFHRHIVQRHTLDGETTVLESFLWLDAARAKYPMANVTTTTMMVPPSESTILASSASSLQVHDINELPNTQVKDPSRMLVVDPIPEIRSILQSFLGWTSAQVHHFIERWPFLRNYPASQLQERLLFLLAPLPPDPVLRQANVTDDVDWPYLFHVQNYGAGLSAPLISQALQRLPDPMLLLRWNFHTDQESSWPGEYIPESVVTTGLNSVPPSVKGLDTMALATLYDQTPPAVVQMTMSTLHLWVTGVSQVDIISLSHLHWQGWNWPSCRIVLHAFRSSLLCNLEPPSWQEELSPAIGTRTSMMAESLAYLQVRLQIRPWHIQAMLKTHSRLSGYTQMKLHQNLEFLQERLHLPSSELQRLSLQMPSLLGASTVTLEERIIFWLERVGLTLPQLRLAVLRKPALLQYSLEKNLEAKRSFFQEDLSLSSTSLCDITTTQPEVWGRSLEAYHWPMARYMCVQCGNMTLPEYGNIVTQVPELLLYSIHNMEQKLSYLQDSVGLVREELKAVIQSTPRILKQSVSSSLQLKIDCIKAANANREMIREIVVRNPALLTLSKARIEKRLLRSESYLSAMPLSIALQHSAKKRRPNKAVWLMVNHNVTDSVELEFSDVAAAALHAETSQSNMYSALRFGRSVNGRKYIYASNGEPTTVASDVRSSVSSNTLQSGISQSVCNVLDDDPSTYSLCISTAGRAFPPEDTVRGRKRAGGMALQIRNWSTKEWGQTSSSLWKGLRLRLLPDARTLIVGYPYTRPSRPRCSLYACREALRVAKEWMSNVSTSNVNVTIACESSYVLRLLQNSTKVYEWGKAETREEFCFTGPGELYKANPDILYPLARTYYNILEQTTVASVKRKNITISFVSVENSDYSRRLRDGAKLAATLMYNSVR